MVYLPFDDDNGSVAFDYSGNVHHGRLIDQAQWTTEGKSGGALSFDGNNDGLAFEKVAYMDRPDAFTISFWFKRNNEMLGIPTNHQIDNLMVAQSSSYDNDNLEIVSEGVKLRYTSTQEGNEDARTQQMEQIFMMIHGITWLLPMGMVSKFLWMGQKDLIGLHTMAYWILLRILPFPLVWAGFFLISGEILTVRSMRSGFTVSKLIRLKSHPYLMQVLVILVQWWTSYTIQREFSPGKTNR